MRVIRDINRPLHLREEGLLGLLWLLITSPHRCTGYLTEQKLPLIVPPHTRDLVEVILRGVGRAGWGGGEVNVGERGIKEFGWAGQA